MNDMNAVGSMSPMMWVIETAGRLVGPFESVAAAERLVGHLAEAGEYVVRSLDHPGETFLDSLITDEDGR